MPLAIVFLTIVLVIIIIFSIFSLSATKIIIEAIAAPWNYRALLTGRDEVPAVNTIATGLADFRISDNNSTLKYRVNLTGINNITGAHMQLGKMGQNGETIVDLFQIGFSKHKKTSYGMILRGNITDSTLKGPLKGKTTKDIITAIDRGDVYVNVNSRNHPTGEIRGQLILTGLAKPDITNIRNSTLAE